MKAQPLRDLYLKYEDDKIDKVINQYFIKANNILWMHQRDNGFLLKTIGFQTQFEILRQYLLLTSDYELENIDESLEKLVAINFSDIFLQLQELVLRG